MKNLFNYATSELSQDAFLRWLLENSDNKELEEISKHLLYRMALGYDEKFDLKRLKVIKTHRQIQNIDIVVDFLLDDKPCLLIIEDKTVSKEHSNQLFRYSEIARNWNLANKEYKDRKIYCCYYKTSLLDVQEVSKIEEVGGWTLLDIDRLKIFFEPYLNHKNQLVKFYAEHIVNLYRKYHEINKEDIVNWDYVDALTYFKKEVNDRFRKYHDGEKVVEYDVYQGRYSSFRIYYTFTNQKLNRRVYPLIEFIFRNDSNNIDLLAHASFRHFSYWTWKWQDEKITLPDKENVIKKIQEAFIKIGFKKPRRNLSSYATQTIATFKIKKNINIDKLNEEIERVIHSFVVNMNEINSNY